MRIQLETPIIARVESARVVLLDISADGARIAHTFPLARGRQVALQFEYDGTTVEVMSEIVRCKIERHGQRVTYCSGIRFVESQESSLVLLRDLIANAIASDFEARRQHLLAMRGVMRG